jgi:hypothetical protein
MKGLYLLDFALMAVLGSLLCQHVDSMNFMVCDGSQGMGVYQCGLLRYLGCQVVVGPCMCMCWGSMCIVVTIMGLFGVLHYYIRLCGSLLCVDEFGRE